MYSCHSILECYHLFSSLFIAVRSVTFVGTSESVNVSLFCGVCREFRSVIGG